jgi:iron complex outermembrane recepter protein
MAVSIEARKWLAAVVGLASPTLLVTVAAVAQDRAANEGPLEELVVTGIRGEARSVTESTTPIDVLSAEEFSRQGSTDLSSLVRKVVPSYNVNTQPTNDASAIVRPANLRGLAPDHALVLVNGKRRHRSAVIYWIGNGVSDGAQAADISAIPASALERVEVLRDGASAQYGSDAIAGVMNFILKDDDHGGNLEARYGGYYAGDGAQYTLSGNIGLPLTDSGFANLSFEYGETDPTSRSAQREDAAALIAAGNTAVGNPAQIWGSSRVDDDLKLFVNLGLELNDAVELYGHGNYVTRKSLADFYYRNPNTREGVYSNDEGETLLIGDLTPDDAGVCPTVPITDNVPDAAALAAVFADANCFSYQEMFPGGFAPRFGADMRDYAALAGIRGMLGERLHWDVSAGYGYDRVDFFIFNTINASYGPSSAAKFDPGSYLQEEQTVNLDLSYKLSDALTLSGGAEYHNETFEIEAGERSSWDFGPLASQGFSAASNGFPGFSDSIAGRWSRANYALYLDAGWRPVERWLVDAAVRWENFEDFGSTTNGKIATNFRVNDAFSVRGSWSTGFRAPTPGQSNASNVSTLFDSELQRLLNTGTIPPTNPVAQLRGGQPLDREKSQSFSVGAIFEMGAFSLTADFYSIDVDDRISVSQDFVLTPEEVAALVASGITSAANLQNFQFFTNDFDTRTRGFDLVASYDMDLLGGRTNLSLAYNNNETKVTRYDPITLDEDRIRQLREALPKTRWNLTGTQTWGDLSALARVSWYDGWYDADDGQAYGGDYILDLEVAYSVNDAMTFVVGAENVLDQYPDENPFAAISGNRYSGYTPYGFNGGFWYGRFSYNFN